MAMSLIVSLPVPLMSLTVMFSPFTFAMELEEGRFFGGGVDVGVVGEEVGCG